MKNEFENKKRIVNEQQRKKIHMFTMEIKILATATDSNINANNYILNVTEIRCNDHRKNKTAFYYYYCFV